MTSSRPATGPRLEPKFPSEPGQRLQWRQGRERTGTHDDGDDGGGGGGGDVDVNENLDEGDDNDPAQESPLAGKRVHKISGGQNSEGSRTSSTSSW